MVVTRSEYEEVQPGAWHFANRWWRLLSLRQVDIIVGLLAACKGRVLLRTGRVMHHLPKP